jgi:aminoglycoside phosphotransferase (APT) family kinase protein
VLPSSIVIKLATTDARPQIDLRRTAAAMARAASAGVPVPSVFGAGLAGDRQYLIMEYVEGITWRELRPRLVGPEVDQAYVDLGHALLALQTLRFESFGELDAGAPAGDGLLGALHRRTDLRVTDSADRHSFHRLLDREAELFDDPGPPTLCHDDLHHENVLFRRDDDRWRLAGILDWDKCWAGPAESDLARMAFWDDMTGAGFWTTYRAAVPEAAGYAERALIYQLLWCLEYPSTSARHRRDRTDLARRLRL